MRLLRTMAAKLDSGIARPSKPDGRRRTAAAWRQTKTAPSAPNAARQPKCVASSVTSGRPPAMASVQPRKTKAMALGALAFRHDHRGRRRRLRRIDGGGRQHEQPHDQNNGVVRRQRRGRLPDRHQGERAAQQQAAVDVGGQPGDQRRADAQHHRAIGDEQADVADADMQTVAPCSLSMPVGASTDRPMTILPSIKAGGAGRSHEISFRGKESAA